MNRKSTAWKKNRQLGDIAGGRLRVKLENNILRKEHSLTAPSPGEDLPILIQENPSRDFYFPVTGIEAREHLKTFPKEDIEGITHLWLRRLKMQEFKQSRRPLAEYIRGSHVCLIVIYPWPRTGLLNFGTGRPSAKTLGQYGRWTSDLIQKNGIWSLRWSRDAVQDFYLTGLLAHEVGHHRDPTRFSKANVKQGEDSADQYALRWLPEGQKQFSIGDPV